MGLVIVEACTRSTTTLGLCRLYGWAKLFTTTILILVNVEAGDNEKLSNFISINFH